MPPIQDLSINVVPQTVKPGWQTTEFWLTLGLHILTALVAGHVFPTTGNWGIVAAFLMSAAAQYSYSGSRADVKGSALDAMAAPALFTPTTGSQSGGGAAIKSLLIALLLFPLFAFGSGGCAALSSPTSAYVAADRATYNAIAPEYQHYVAADPNLDAAQKARRQRTAATWEFRLEQAGSTGSPQAGSKPAVGSGQPAAGGGQTSQPSPQPSQ